MNEINDMGRGNDNMAMIICSLWEYSGDDLLLLSETEGPLKNSRRCRQLILHSLCR